MVNLRVLGVMGVAGAFIVLSGGLLCVLTLAAWLGLLVMPILDPLVFAWVVVGLLWIVLAEFVTWRMTR